MTQTHRSKIYIFRRLAIIKTNQKDEDFKNNFEKEPHADEEGVKDNIIIDLLNQLTSLKLKVAENDLGYEFDHTKGLIPTNIQLLTDMRF
jgi:hypothetical protein